MPTYDYRCKKCNHEFEAFQSMSEPTLKTCPQCGKRSLQRLIGAGAGIIFKGNGFYITDYKRGSSSSAGAAKTSKSPATSEKSGSSGSSGSSED
jgi:putative FmdB family regulatory protein